MQQSLTWMPETMTDFIEGLGATSKSIAAMQWAPWRYSTNSSLYARPLTFVSDPSFSLDVPCKSCTASCP